MHVTYFKSWTRIVDWGLLNFTLQSAITGKSRKMILTLPTLTLNVFSFENVTECKINDKAFKI